MSRRGKEAQAKVIPLGRSGPGVCGGSKAGAAAGAEHKVVSMGVAVGAEDKVASMGGQQSRKLHPWAGSRRGA